MFKCGICGKTSRLRQRIGGMVPILSRRVEYHAPKETSTGRQLGEHISTGVEIVREVIACANCASLPTKFVDGVTIRLQPPQVVYLYPHRPPQDRFAGHLDEFGNPN